MNLHLDDLTINVSKLNSDSILECWLWLIKDFEQILIISKMGDLFYQASDQSVYWLSTDSGTLTQVAASPQEFDLLLKLKENVDNWFLPSLIEQPAVARRPTVP